MMHRSLDYPAGQPAISSAEVTRRRKLPFGAQALVHVGASIKPDQPLYELASGSPGRNRVLSGVAGTVSDVVPSRYIEITGVHALLQGILGVGGTAAGPLTMLTRSESPAVASMSPGSVIYHPHPLPLILLQRAAASGVHAVIGPSMPARELEAFLRADLTTVFLGQNPDQAGTPLTIVLLEGVGTIPVSAFAHHVLLQHLGQIIAVDGTTSFDGNQRPEILMAPLMERECQSLPAPCFLANGIRVSIVNGQWRGMTGTITWLSQRLHTSEQGWAAPSATVALDDGTSARVPVHALVRIE